MTENAETPTTTGRDPKSAPFTFGPIPVRSVQRFVEVVHELVPKDRTRVSLEMPVAGWVRVSVQLVSGQRRTMGTPTERAALTGLVAGLALGCDADFFAEE